MNRLSLKINRQSFCFIVMPLLCQAPCLANDPLQGRIEQRNAMTRLSRPAMPSRPMGEALEHAQTGKMSDIASGTMDKKKKTATAIGQLFTDQSQFILNLKQNSPPDFGKSEKDKQMILAWEEWHKRLVQAIYQDWQTYGNIPGDAVVSLSITKEGEMEFEMKQFAITHAFDRISDKQSELFEGAVARTLQMIDHSAVLPFPTGSQRNNIQLNVTFSYTNADNGTQGYTWKHGDYEQINARR